MLESALVGFAIAHFVDALLPALALAGAAFAWEQWLVALNPASPGVYWAVWAAGVAVALVGRLLAGRTRVALLGNTDTTPRQLIVAGLLVVVTTWYPLKIEDPASTLVAPFAIGAVLSWLAITLLLLAVELIDYYTGALAHEFHPRSTCVLAWIGLSALIALDLCAWLGGWLIVVLGLAAFGALFAIGLLVRAAGGGRPRSPLAYRD